MSDLSSISRTNVDADVELNDEPLSSEVRVRHAENTHASAQASMTRAAAVAQYLRYFGPLAGLLFAISILRGWRLPGLWSATHFTFNYSQGFIRRGLVGELLRRLGGPTVYHYTTFLKFAWVMFAVAGVMVALLIRRACKTAPRDLDLRCAALVLGASLANSELAHLVGYLDYLGLIGVIAVLLLAARAQHPYTMFALVLPLGIVSTFIHEGLTLIFAPTMLFVMACRGVAEHRARSTRSATPYVVGAAAVLATGLFFAFSAAIGHYGTRPPAQILALKDALQAQVDYPLRPDAFEALWRSAKENVEVLMPGYYRAVPAWYILRTAVLPMLPAYAFMLVYGGMLLRRLDVTLTARVLLSGLAAAASVSPLLLYLVGWDHARWHSWATYCAFLCICSLRIFIPARERSDAVVATPALLAFGAAAIACSLSGEIDLFDGFRLQGFPFEPNFRFFIDQVKEGFPHRPPR